MEQLSGEEATGIWQKLLSVAAGRRAQSWKSDTRAEKRQLDGGKTARKPTTSCIYMKRQGGRAGSILREEY